ncbi:MAG: hypothetical protein WD335_00535 [Candidatus Paceibacterota bacterium]
MIAITSGEKYVDVDALACAVVYQELLTQEEKAAIVVFSGDLNHSISPLVKSQEYNTRKDLPENSIEGFVLVDVSDPEHIASFVDLQKVKEVYDHHYGFIDFWESKISPENSKIEMIGACATLIWEEFKKRGSSDISTSSANLLSLAIVSNTLNLNSPLTSDRDRAALDELEKYINFPSDWKKKYFSELEEFIFSNPKKAIINDTKIEKIPQLEKPLVIGQIELWDGSDFVKNNIDSIRDSLGQKSNPYWMISIPSIKEGWNYIYSENDMVKMLIQKVTGCSFLDNVCITNKLILRKEILRDLNKLDNS